MMPRLRWRGLALLVGLALLFGPLVASSLTARITMPPTTLGISKSEVTADTLKPDECNGIALANVVTGPSPLNGSTANDLILGTGGADTINGGNGDDCIVSGDGADTIDGGDGNDICIATAAATFVNCELRIPAP